MGEGLKEAVAGDLYPKEGTAPAGVSKVSTLPSFRGIRAAVWVVCVVCALAVSDWRKFNSNETDRWLSNLIPVFG